MKIKPLYIYLLIFVAFLVGVIIFSTGKDSKTMHGQMPDDEIHRGIGEMPNNENAMESAKQKLEDLKTAYEKNPNDTLKTREYADMLTFAHQPEKAIELYNKILKTDSKRTDILLQLTFLHFNQGDMTKAEEYTNRILLIDKNHQLGMYNSGVLQQVKGDNKGAKEIWEKLIKLYPNSTISQIAEESIKGLDNTNQ